MEAAANGDLTCSFLHSRVVESIDSLAVLRRHSVHVSGADNYRRRGGPAEGEASENRQHWISQAASGSAGASVLAANETAGLKYVDVGRAELDRQGRSGRANEIHRRSGSDTAETA